MSTRKTSEEVSYHALSFNGQVYHILLPDVRGNYTLCNSKRRVMLDDSHLISGKSPLVSLASVIWPQIPRPGTICRRCLRTIAALHDKSHLGYDEYEDLVLGILQRHYKHQGKRIVKAKSGKSNIWVGQSDCQHQIDVSVELEDEIVLAECKCLNKAVDVPLVLTFLARIIDIKPTKPEKHIHGIMFSNLGFQGDQDSNIMKLAEYYHDYIELQVVYSYGWDA